MTITVNPLTATYEDWAHATIEREWGTALMVSRGVLYDVLTYPGFVALFDDQPQGLVTYRIDGKGCEILILQSAIERQGIGAALVDKVRSTAIKAGCKRLWLITTNDNIKAFRWYQRQGFTIKAVHVNALAKSRKLKPEIPLVGQDGIPLRDEIEFVMDL
ncbi:MAG: GNAT family N-acetyltransferase [Anaerolineae bacterium]|nr:GNAT family N-acetyltransferase [Anaerolineae bacterium]